MVRRWSVKPNDGGSIPSAGAEVSRALGRAAKVPAFQAGEVGSIPTGHSVDRVGSSAAEQVPVKYQRAGSSPARPSEIDAG